MRQVELKFYFGCASGQGHILICASSRPRPALVNDLPDSWPFHPHGWDLDGKYAPTGPQVQSLARVVHVGDVATWTVLAMWDRSEDKRPNSNSAFIAHGEHTFEEMTAMAAERFPAIWKRINDAAPVVEWKPQEGKESAR